MEDHAFMETLTEQINHLNVLSKLTEQINHLKTLSSDSGARFTAYVATFFNILETPHHTLSEIETQNALLRQLATIPLR